MKDETAAPPEPDAAPQEPDVVSGIPLGLRLLGTLVVAALIVGLYAVVQLTSSDEPGPPPSVGLGETIQPFGSGDPPEAGLPAPDFSVPTLDGAPFSLSSHLAQDGRPVFVNMWAEWCFPCRAEMPAIDAVARRHPEVHFIGVVIRDREEPVRTFIEKYEITYQIGMDIDAGVEEAYFVWVMPTTYLIGSDGIVVERIFGPIDEEKLEEVVANLVASGT